MFGFTAQACVHVAGAGTSQIFGPSRECICIAGGYCASPIVLLGSLGEVQMLLLALQVSASNIRGELAGGPPTAAWAELVEDFDAARCTPDTEDDVAQRHEASCNERNNRRVRRRLREVPDDDGPSPPPSRWKALVLACQQQNNITSAIRLKLSDLCSLQSYCYMLAS